MALFHIILSSINRLRWARDGTSVEQGLVITCSQVKLMDGYLSDIRYSKSAFSEHHLHWKIPGMFQSLASSCRLYLRIHKKQLPYGHHCGDCFAMKYMYAYWDLRLVEWDSLLDFFLLSSDALPPISFISLTVFFFFLPIVVIHFHLCIASCLYISCSIICSFSADSRKGLPVLYVMLLL